MVWLVRTGTLIIIGVLQHLRYCWLVRCAHIQQQRDDVPNGSLILTISRFTSSTERYSTVLCASTLTWNGSNRPKNAIMAVGCSLAIQRK